MDCSNCGKPIKEENSFCPYCGSKVGKAVDLPVEEVAIPTPAASAELVPEEPQEKVEQEVAKPQEKVETAPSAAYAFSSENDPAAPAAYNPWDIGDSAGKGKKKKSVGKFLSGLLLMVVAIGIVGFLAWEPVVSFALRTFSPETYFVYVQGKGLKEGFRSMEKALDSAFELKDMGSDSTIQLNVGSELQELAKSLGGTQGKQLLDWVSDVKVELSGDISGDLSKTHVAIYSGKSQVITGEVVFDTDEEMIYLSVPELFEDTLRLDVGEQMNLFDEDDEQILDSSTIRSIVLRYGKIFLQNLDDVSVEKGAYQLENSEKGDYVITVNVTQKDLLNALIEMVKVAKNDNELKDLVCECAARLSGSDDNIQWKSSMNSLLDELKEAKEDMDEDEELFVYKLYVNGWNNRILGCEVIVEELELEGGYFNDGKDLDFYFTQGDEVEMKVSGKTENKTTDLNGNLKIEEKSIWHFTAQFDEKHALLRMEMGEDLKTELIRGLNLNGSDYAKYMDVVLEVEYTVDAKNHATSRLAILLSGKSLVELNVEETMRKAEDISVPAKKNTTDDVEAWVEDFSMSDLEDLLEKANVPSFLY